MILNRREFLKYTGAGMSALGLPLASLPSCSKKTEAVRIGYLPITDATPLLIAHARGFYEDEGLKTEKPVRVRNWSTLSESLLTEKFNLAHLLLPIPVWMRYNMKAPVKVLAWDHTNGSALTVRPDLEIRGFEDLGGKQLAVPYWYSMHNIILQMGLRKAGLKPVIQNLSKPLKKNEVNLFILPPSEMPLALSGKKIDGYIVAEPFNAIAELKIGAKIMRFTGDMWKNHPCCVVVMKEALINSNPVFIQKTINAVVRAQRWITQHPEETAKILSREGKAYLPIPEKILHRVFNHYDTADYGKGAVPRAIRHPEWKIGRIGFQPFPYPSATRFIVDEMRRTLMEGNKDFLESLKPDFAVKDLVDDRFVKKAILNAGGPSAFGDIDLNAPWDRQEVVSI